MSPEDKLIIDTNNPPSVTIEFFKEQKNINLINCFSNEGGEWKNSKLNYLDNFIKIELDEKFLPEEEELIAP